MGATLSRRFTVGGRTIEVAATAAGVSVAGRALEARWTAVDGTPLFHLILDGRSWEVVAESAGAGRWRLVLGGRVVEVVLQDERTRR